MKIRYFMLVFAILALSACAQAARAEPLATTSASADLLAAAVAAQSGATNKVVTQSEATNKPATQAEATSKIEALCTRNSEETQLLINDIQRYCLQYPVGYDMAIENEMAIALFKRSTLNSEDPSVFITVEPAGGRTVEQVADQLVADYSFPGMEVKRVSLKIDQEQAIALDGLTGESINRHVVVLHNDRLYHMTIMPMDSAQAEGLYNILIKSFNFRPETNLCPDCPPTTQTP